MINFISFASVFILFILVSLVVYGVILYILKLTNKNFSLYNLEDKYMELLYILSLGILLLFPVPFETLYPKSAKIFYYDIFWSALSVILCNVIFFWIKYKHNKKNINREKSI